LITEGRIRVQSWGEAAYDVSVGDAVVFAPGEKHWHGAVAGGRGVHLAVNVNVKTEWLEPVSEEDYTGRRP
jgi:quercetin dioxygenase-like cupin family protein